MRVEEDAAMMLSEAEREALRREIGPPTDQDRKWQPMVSAHEVRALLGERDNLSARLAAVEALADRLITHGPDCRCYLCLPVHNLRAALHSDPSEA